jgi:hypothetical protein
MVAVGWRPGLGLGLASSPASWRRLAAAAAVVACLAASSCGGGGGGRGDGASGPTVPDGPGGSGSSSSAPSTTAAAAAIDITTKPSVVTVAYADAVMDELDRLLSDAIRDFVANDGPTKTFDDLLNAVYDEPSLENQRSDFGRDAVDGMALYRRPPGDVTTRVAAVIKTEPSCVVLVVDRTFAATLLDPKPRSSVTSYVALEPTDSNGDPANLNATPWSIVFDGTVLEGEEPKNAC